MALVLTPARKDAGQVAELARILESSMDTRGIERRRLLAPFDSVGLAEGREQLGEARRTIAADHRLQHIAEAEALLTRALLNVKGALGAVDKAEVVEIYRGLALTRAEAGDRRLGGDYLRTATHLAPTLTEADFSNSRKLRDLFRELQASYGTLKPCRLRVESSPPGAEVYLGDELMGYTPLTIEGLKEGTRLVRLRLDGFYSHGWLSDVSPAGQVRLRHKLRPLGGSKRAEGWIRALTSAKTWKKKPELAVEAADGLRRLFRATDLVVATVKRTKTGYVLSGAVAPKGKPARRMEAALPIDASLIKNVRTLGYEWLP